MTEFKPIKEGKVREIYDNGDSLIMVATDRISAFDVILKNKVTKKGTVLTQMSKFWFDYTRDLLPNHMLSVDVKDMPEFFRQPQFDGNSMLCRKLTMLPIECIVRGYITGSGWASYQKTGKVCGIQLPEGLQESQKLPEPIYTPSTKAEIGDHDENISYERSIEVLEKQFPGHGLEYATKLRDYTIALYKKCAEYALTRGIIIADTKFEFGVIDGQIILADEPTGALDSKTSQEVMNLLRRVNVEQVLSWQEDRLYFRAEPLASIARSLERQFNVDITIPDERLRRICFTGEFVDGENIHEIMRIISADSRILCRSRKNHFELYRNR